MPWNKTIRDNEALAVNFWIDNVNFSSNSFYMEIKDLSDTLKETVTLSATYEAPNTRVQGILSQPEVEALGVGKYKSDVVMYSTFPKVLFDINLSIIKGATQLP